MAVGAGSIKRASKLNAETKKTVAPEAVEEKVPVKEATEKKAPAKKTTTGKTTAKKTTEAKTTETKTTAKKTTTRKTPAKKAAEEKPAVEVKNSVETSVISNIDPVVLDVVFGKKEKKNQVCHLTEDMPIHLL